MKKYIYIISILILSMQFFACSDFLTEESEDKFTTATLFETPEGLEKMSIALYAYERGLATKGDANGYLATQIWGERTTDLSLFTTGSDANLCRYSSPGPTSNIRGLIYSPYWTHRYYIIGRANEIIHYGQKFGEETKRTVGEASFWRAYSYYGLWSRFSRLYLSTEPISKENLEGLTYTPADSIDVFKLMYDDLDTAIKGLPVIDDKSGRVTQDAARHLKALVAAWAKDWSEVEKQVDEIETNGSHTLVGDPHNIFDRQDTYNTSETLFALNFSKERGGGRLHRLGSQYINVISEIDYTHKMINGVLVKYNEDNLGKSWGLAYPNSYLMSLYPNADKRITAYYKTHYTYQNPSKLITIPTANLETDASTGKTYYSTTNQTGSPYNVAIGDTIYGRDVFAATGKKIDRRNLLPSSIKMYDHWDKPLDADGAISSKDVIVYRLAESYLLAAEACVKQNKQDRARYYFNKTWTRAGHNAITTDITFDMIKDEHARELAFEGRRWDFLKRNGIWYSQMIKYAGDFTKFPGTNVGYNAGSYGVSDGRDANFAPNPDYYADFNGSDNDVRVRFNVKPIHVNWPIPQDQIDAMGPQNFPQTEGY